MDRFMLHLKNEGFAPADASDLLRRARSLCSGTGATVRDTRVSSRYIEYDVSVPMEEIEEIVSGLESIGGLESARHLVDEGQIDKRQAMMDGVSYFNDERFWEAHEALEGVWKGVHEGEKDLVQGIILVAAALVHHQKNEDRICVSMLGRALSKLAGADGEYFGIDVGRVRGRVEAMRRTGQVGAFTI